MYRWIFNKITDSDDLTWLTIVFTIIVKTMVSRRMNELFIWVSMKLSGVWACIKFLFPIATCGCETQALSKLDTNEHF